MSDDSPRDAAPDPASDWIDQRELARTLGISEKTASAWAALGRLHVFEHGSRLGGRRKYSRTLVRRELERHWVDAVSRIDRSATGAAPARES